ncbi:uncharacterized protein [Asterias amurensis]|uniref:uncharacterized protein n=1 Tax=Asterias amurensis TaxID=7602 RepID=UPI003AB897D3
METKQRKHKCKFCDKTFDRRWKRTRHVEYHKDRPYTCLFCDNSFKESHMANKHVLDFHKHEMKSDQIGLQQYFKMLVHVDDGPDSGKMARYDKAKHRFKSKSAGGIDAAAYHKFLCDCSLGFRRRGRFLQHQMYCQIFINRVKARKRNNTKSQREKREKQLKKSKSNTSFHCNRCPSTFRLMESLEEHRRLVHYKKKARPSRAEMKRNIQYSVRRVVSKASEATVSRGPMATRAAVKLAFKKKEKHSRTPANFQEGSRTEVGACSICGKLLAQRSFAYHYRLHNVDTLNAKYLNESTSGNQVLYLCRYEACNRAFSNKDGLKNHEVDHLGSKPFMCDLCDLLLETGFKHKVHIQACIRQIKAIACSYCGKFFGTKDKLAYHEKFVHITKETEASYFCGHCFQNFPTRPELNWHHFNMHQNLNPSSNGIFYQCTFCSIKIKSRSKLIDHVQSEHWSEIASSTDLDGLGSNLQNEENKWECNQCCKTFDQKISLTEHEKNHSSQAPFKCNGCERQFMLRAALKRHSKNCLSTVATSKAIHGETNETVRATEEYDDNVIRNSTTSSCPSPSPPPFPPASLEMQSVQIQRLNFTKPVSVRRPGSTEVHHQFTNSNSAEPPCSGAFAKPTDQVYLIEYSSEQVTNGPLTFSLPDENTSRAAIRILPEGLNLPVPIPVKLERVF